jgi:hypothetical protein
MIDPRIETKNLTTQLKTSQRTERVLTVSLHCLALSAIKYLPILASISRDHTYRCFGYVTRLTKRR